MVHRELHHTIMLFDLECLPEEKELVNTLVVAWENTEPRGCPPPRLAPAPAWLEKPPGTLNPEAGWEARGWDMAGGGMIG